MSDKKQSSVEWLVEKIQQANPSFKFDALIRQAIEMEKQQIEDAYEIGFADAWDDARYDDEPKYAGAEQYYNETFGDE
jgi:hypothetical protein